MAEVLKKRLKQRRFEGPVQEAVLSLLVASAALRERLNVEFSAQGLTSTQYNVLRILRGRHPDGCARCDIIERLIEKAPDVTRLIDRLIERGLVERIAAPDRRLSVARITPAGLRLLKEMDPAIEAVYREIGERVSEEELRRLSSICEKLFDVES